MSKAQFRILMLLTVISGLVGGGLSDLLFRGLAARAAQATTAPKVIEAQEFRVVDGAGKPRAELGADSNGAPYLCLLDAEGKRRAMLILFQDGRPQLSLIGAEGMPSVLLGMGLVGGPELALCDAAGMRLVDMKVLGDGGRLWLRGANESPRVSLSGSGYCGNLWLFGGDLDGRHMRVSLGGNYDGCALTISDAEGHHRAVVGCTKTVTKRTGAETKYPESTITLFKENGDVLWQAP